jgi:hypothetical protein
MVGQYGTHYFEQKAGLLEVATQIQTGDYEDKQHLGICQLRGLPTGGRTCGGAGLQVLR